MVNKPFRFLDSPLSVERLRQELGEIGLAEAKAAKRQADDEPAEPDPYHPACLRFACPWLNGLVEIHWHYSWWPDGMSSELERVSVVSEGVVRSEVNVEELLQQRLEQPLAEVLMARIRTGCAEVMRKLHRPSQRGYR